MAGYDISGVEHSRISARHFLCVFAFRLVLSTVLVHLQEMDMTPARLTMLAAESSYVLRP
jgi:hypothetical protein